MTISSVACVDLKITLQSVLSRVRKNPNSSQKTLHLHIGNSKKGIYFPPHLPMIFDIFSDLFPFKVFFLLGVC